MMQWEYHKRRYMDCDFDVLGNDGWELVFVVPDPNHTGYGQYMCIFKRPRLPEQNITDPQKPTKPALCGCKRTPDRHIQTVKGDGWLDCDGVVRFYS